MHVQGPCLPIKVLAEAGESFSTIGRNDVLCWTKRIGWGDLHLYSLSSSPHPWPSETRRCKNVQFFPRDRFGVIFFKERKGGGHCQATCLLFSPCPAPTSQDLCQSKGTCRELCALQTSHQPPPSDTEKPVLLPLRDVCGQQLLGQVSKGALIPPPLYIPTLAI